MQTILAFDTATGYGAICALTTGGATRRERPAELLAAVDELVDDPARIEGIVAGRGPGSFTSIRIGLAVGRSLAQALDVPLRGASTLDAYAGGMPVIDARRGEVFHRNGVCRPDELDVAGCRLLGDGAVRYRELFERAGAEIPPDDDPAHVPDPLLLVRHAGGDVEPLYGREPDARPAA